MTDILQAVHDYIIKFTDTPPEIIYRGYQNRTALPKSTPESSLIVIAGSVRRGTNTGETSVDDNGNMCVKSLREYTVNVDFCSYEQMNAQGRAGVLETLGRSGLSVEFFAGYGISFLYAEDLQYLPYKDEADQYMHRYRVALHLSVWEEATVVQEYFNKAGLKIENVDVHHPPR